MSYIEQSLGAGEAVIARAKFHWLYVTSAWIALIGPGIFLLACLSWSESEPAPFAAGDKVTWYTVLAAILFLWGLATFFKVMVRVRTTELGVTSHRFVEKYGLF